MNALKQLAIPAMGFGVGWLGWDFLEKNEVLTEDHHKKVAIWRLKLMEKASLVVPSGTFALTPEEISERLELLHKSTEPQPDNRVKFVEVLQQCRIQEQLEWMEEHAEEEIPFFFIADLFHAFGALHETDLILPVGAVLPSSSAVNEGQQGQAKLASSSASSAPNIITPVTTDRSPEDDKRFGSPILVRRTFEMMVTGVMPYDVACRVLAVLALKNSDNRKQLLELVSQKNGDKAVNTILSKWAAYHEDLKEKETPEGDAIVSANQVDIATLQLLRSLDEASVRSSKRGALTSALLFWKPEGEVRRVWSNLGESADTNAAVVDVCNLFDRARTKAFPIGHSSDRVVDEGFTFLKCAERLSKKEKE